ncbi:MAG: excinuclease ABC subunit UvrC [Bacteroidales bacterium]|nr:excinuclease ABC subunit UvrC [Bacteroidales bacterium]MDD4421363.1 excinuclease ABC subunit UvrC [Bacteroidales bacterium]
MSHKDTINLREKISLLPDEPGVYRFLNSDGKIIYVGKAKNLKKRVRQYFVDPDRLNAKTQVLVSKIADLQHTVVSSEQDALLLENNLIKQYQPRYNILLKDSKSYPWICIKNESFPRMFITRRLVKDGSLYFGPYGSALYAHHLLDLFHSLFKLRSCSLKLNTEDINNGKFKECLNWHIKKCAAPCIGKISEKEYNTQIEYIKSILKGNTSPLVREFKEKMNNASAAMKFEEAEIYKERMQTLNAHYNKSLIVQPTLSNIDVFSIVFSDSGAYGNYMRVSSGCIIQTMNLELKTNIEESKEDMLTHFILDVYDILENVGTTPNPEILVPFEPSGKIFGEDKYVHVPLRGDKLNLLELSRKNATEFKFQNLKQDALKNPEHKSVSVEMLKKDLHLQNSPVHIECFDNSNIQGTNPVASCVVFKNGRPSKKDYRKFNIKSVVGANDFASMYEVVFRRYSRILDEDGELPQLIVVDGGKGQLDFAYKALTDLNLNKKIPIIGIAKRLEELIVPGDPTPLFLDKNSPGLKLIMQLRDEAHRFGITFHRLKRSKGQINSELRDIKGIGEETEKKLLQRYKSVARLREISAEELTEFAGAKVAQAIKSHFENHL